jgi:hypothetical protein
MFKQIISVVCSAAGTIGSAALAADQLPTQQEVQALLVTESCQSLKIDITRLSDMTALPSVEIPLCIELPAMTAEACVPSDSPGTPSSGSPGGVLPGDYICPLSPVDPNQKYIHIKTPGYEFAAYTGDIGPTFATGWVVTGGSSSYLVVTPYYRLSDAWNYRLTNILNQYKGELPVAFASLILPNLMDPAQGVGVQGIQAVKGGPVTFTPSAPVFNPVQAVGYDASGQEYGVHISTVYPQASSRTARR